MAPTPFGHSGLFGGGERYPLQLARALAASVDCELVTFGRSAGVTPDHSGRDHSGLTVRVLRPLRYARNHVAHPIAAGLPAALAGADIVHTHHLRSAPSRIAALLPLRSRRVVTDHGLGGGDWLGLLPRRFDAFACVSRYSAETLGSPLNTAVIYGGADVDRFRPDSGDRDGVLFVGRLTPHKGVDRLLLALPPGAQLAVVGTAGHDPRPPQRDYPRLLAHLAADRDVRFAGRVSDDELAEAYRRAVVLALPSVDRTCYGRDVRVSELLGLVALEAMASGTPVVASRVGGVPEVVLDGETGYLVEPGDVAALRDRLSALLADRRLARRMGDNARAVVCERFTWAATARRCLALYARLGRSP